MDSIKNIGAVYSAYQTSFIPTNISTVDKKESFETNDAVNISSLPKNKEKNETVKITVLPQDPSVSSVKIAEIPKNMIGSKIEGPKMYSIDYNNPKAIPDLDGNYIYDIGLPQFDQVNSYATAYKTFNMLESMFGKSVDWAFGNPRLGVNPHKKEGMNAYYSRNEASVNFFYFNSEPLGKTVQTSQSTDIVSHEVGHAVLDGIRPGYLGWDTETMSVHEALADTTSLLFALHDEDTVKAALLQNGGNMETPSILSKVGEEFGIALAKSDNNPNNDDKDYLRSLINNFKYVDPSTLPQRADEDSLANESHSFSRVLSGANYEIVSSFYSSNLKSGMTPSEALKKAGSDFGELFIKAVGNCPDYQCKYKDVAANLLKADKLLNGGTHAEDIKQIFLERNILSKADISALDKTIPSVKAKDPSNISEISSILAKHGKNFGVEDGTSFSMGSASDNIYGGKTVSLSCSEDMPLGKEFGKFENCFVKVKGGIRLDFDKHGKLVDFSYDKIDDAKREDIREGVLIAAKSGRILEGNSTLNEQDPMRWVGQVTPDRSGKKFIERIPVINYF